MGKSLIIYFSRKGENYWNGHIRNLEKGNTAIVAEKIANMINGEVFEVQRAKAYPDQYHACTREAKIEQDQNLRPELGTDLTDINAYDTIFIGYPNWWGTMPMAMFSCLEKLEWQGKKVLPFCTHEGSGMGNSEADLKRICQGATVFPGLAIRGYQVGQSEAKIAQWLKENHIERGI